MPAEHSGQTTQEARHTGVDPLAGLPTQSVVILLHSGAGLDEAQRVKLGDKGAVAVAFFDNAIAFYQRAETQRASEFFNRALTIFREVGALEYEAKTLNNLGAVYCALNDLPQALDHFEKALPAFQGIEDRYGEACTLHNFGAVYYALDEPRQALEFHNLALPIFKELSDWKHAAFALGNIGLAHYQLGEWPQALEAFKHARMIFKELGHKYGEACALYTIGITHNNSGEWLLALEAFKQAKPLYEELGHRSGKGFMLYNIGLAHDNLGEPQQALEAFVEAQEIYKKLGDRENEATILKWVKALEAKSLDKLSPDALLSPGDTTTQEGMEPETEHMDADGQRVVESFERLPPAQRQEVLAELVARVETANEFKQAARAVLLPPVTPEEIANIPQWRGRKLDGMPVDFLEKHYRPWLKRFGAPADRVFQDQIRHHNLELIHGLQNQLREAGKGEKVRDYLPTRSTRIDATVRNNPEAVLNNPRIVGTLYSRHSRARRAAKLQASDQPRI